MEAVTRTIEDVKKEYAQICAELGELSYKEELFKKESARMLIQRNGKMDQLLKLQDEANLLTLKKPEHEAAAATPAA